MFCQKLYEGLRLPPARQNRVDVCDEYEALFAFVRDKKGNIKVDSKLRDKEQIPLTYEGGMEAFFEQEVKPYVPDAIPDYDNAIIGYELSFTKYFYKPVELRPIEDIRADIEAIERDTDGLLDIISEAKAGISRVLTKGLNPETEMKDSGIEWIGEIPRHWSMRRIKNIFTESKSKSTTGEETPLSLSKENGIIPSSEKTNRTMESESYVGSKLVSKGDIVFNRFKARLFALSKYAGVVSSDYAVYKCSSDADSEYMVKLLSTDMYREAFNRKASGIGDGFSRLYTEDLFSMYAIFPPLSEQHAIVAYIQQMEDRINKAIAGIEREIELVKEYKTRLVSDVVTGKVDVRDVAVPRNYNSIISKYISRVCSSSSLRVSLTKPTVS